MAYSGAKIKIAKLNGLGGETFTRNMTDARTHTRTDEQGTDFGMKLKKKAGNMSSSSEVKKI